MSSGPRSEAMEWRAPRRSGFWGPDAAVTGSGRGANSAAAPKRLDLEVSRITVSYPNGHVALHEASLRLDGPTICGLLGVNGAGKSTLFKAVMGLVTPAAGAVRIGGRSVTEAQRSNWVAYVPQAEEVDWAFPVSVRDVVMMGRYGYMGLLRIPRTADRQAVEVALRRVGMADFADRQIGQLSGGQRKRVFLARALAQDGQLILLDEPFAGVDVTTQEQIVDLLRELRTEGRIILVSTHELSGVREFCDQVVLVKGTVLAAGPTEQVFNVANLARAFGESLRKHDLGAPGEPARVVSGEGGRKLVLAADGTLLGRLDPGG